MWKYQKESREEKEKNNLRPKEEIEEIENKRKEVEKRWKKNWNSDQREKKREEKEKKKK